MDEGAFADADVPLASLAGLPPLLGGAPAAVPVPFGGSGPAALASYSGYPGCPADGGAWGPPWGPPWGPLETPAPLLLAHDADLSPAVPLSPAQVGCHFWADSCGASGTSGDLQPAQPYWRPRPSP